MNSLSSASVPGNRFVANQAFSSAQMVRQMVLDEMRRGDFSNLTARVTRIEELVRQALLKREDERRLTLLAAQFLEAAGETKRALRMVGQLLADEDTLAEELFVDLRRFRVRLLLNIGNVADARTEVERIERVVLSTEGTFGASVEAVDGDNSRVSLLTWLLTAEVCIGEGKSVEATAALRSAFETMKRDGQSIEDGVMFELLSALVCYLAGDDGGIPALAYLYRVHVVLESSVDASIRARIAAAAGDMDRVAGLSRAEAARWRNYGPDRNLVVRYLSEGEGVVPPSDLLARILPSEIIPVDAGEITKVVRRAEFGEGSRVLSAGVPMSFQFEAFGIEEISSMFDFNMKTGPLVIDWSACDKELVDEAIEAGAISAQARISDRGTIYFNNGSYVDARFDGAVNGDSGPAVLETIFELFRISMARLPGAYGYQAASGAPSARVPEIVNLRPNNVNIDLMKRLDHLRTGIEVEEENIDSLFEQWREPVAETGAIVDDTVVVAGATDIAVGMDLGFVSKLGRIMEATEVAQVNEAAGEALTLLGLENPRLEFVVAGAERSLNQSSDGNDSYVVAEEYSSGPVTAKLLLSGAVVINCPEAVRAVLNASAQRLRTVSGRMFDGRTEISEFVAADPVTQSLLSTLRDFAVLDGTAETPRLRHICLVGERGVGKEILARLIHNWSGRAQKPFVAVNFCAISKELAASEIFGSRKGAFTGAEKDRDGLIQQAEGGTLFLDELDEATDSVQALVKRAVEYGVFNVVGDPRESKANVRYVAATNVVDIDSLKIKRDLKDRFLLLRVPPLRERRGDIRPLAERFAAEYERMLPEPVMVFLEQLDWPGNVRQLRNVIERSCAATLERASELTLDLVQRSAIEDGAIVAECSGTGMDFVPLRTNETLEMRVDEVEKRHILYMLNFCKGHRTHAAQALGMTRQSLFTRIKKFGL